MHALKMSSELFKHGREHVFLPLPGTHMLSDPMGEYSRQQRAARKRRGTRKLTLLLCCLSLSVTVNMYTRLVLFLKQHVHTE
jgi:hypothetical protein